MKKTSFIIIIFFMFCQYSEAQIQLSIDKAINIAVHNNPAIMVAKSQIESAEAKYTTVHATFLPQANIISKYFYSNSLPGMYPLEGVSVPVLNNGKPTGDNIIMHPMAPFANNSRDVFKFDVNVVYPIYTGKKRVNAIESIKNMKNAYNNNLKETESSLRYKVRMAYYNNLLINDVIEVYKEALQQLNKHLALADTAYKVGVRSEFDVLNFQSKIKAFESKIIELEGKKQIAQTALRNLLNLPDTTQFICTGSIENFEKLLRSTNNINLDEIKSENYRLKSLADMKKALSRKEKIEAAENLPTLFAFGNYHVYHGIDFPPFDKTWHNGYAVGLGIKMNIFNGNQTKGKVDEVKADMDKIDAYKEGLTLKLRYEYQTAVQQIASLVAQENAQTAHLKVAEKAYHIAEIGYKNGVTTNIELNDAQLNVTKVKTRLLNIKKNILIEYAKLEYLRGNNH